MLLEWVIFCGVVCVGNFLMIGSQLVDISGIAGLYISGALSEKGTSSRRLKLAGIIASVFEGIVGTTLAALVLVWYARLTPEVTYDNPLTWLGWEIAYIAAIIPSAQSVLLRHREYVHDRQTWILRLSTALANPIATLSTMLFTFLFVIVPYLLDAVFYPLLVLAGLVTFTNLFTIVTVYRSPRWRENTHREKPPETNANT